MQLDALNRQGKKRGIDICSNGTYVETSREEVAKNNDTSASQIRRYIRLNYLTDELLNMVDENILGFRPAVEISYLSSESQKIIESLMKNQNIKISLKQAEILKTKEGEIGQLSLDVILEVLSDKNKNNNNKKIAIPLTKIKKYFDEDICEDEIVNKIIELLETIQL